MKKALISTWEPREFSDGSKGYRVAQVELEENMFGVAEGLYWTDCADDVVADQFYFDTTLNEIKPVPVPPPATTTPATDQPVTDGLQTV